MRTLKLIEHISLDGVIQNSRDGGDFPYTDWSVPYRTPAGRDALLGAHGASFDLLLGRRTYDLWSSFWPTAPSSPFADRLNPAKKYVVTHRPESLAWGPFEAVGPDLVEGVRRIKLQEGPNLVLSGSSTLTSILLEHGLADEVLLIVYPLLLGTGKRFFAQAFGQGIEQKLTKGTKTNPPATMSGPSFPWLPSVPSKFSGGFLATGFSDVL
jgi:dihydrofolate reductase